MNKKHFIITIDTEGDNQWEWAPGKTVQTKNAAYLGRFQNLCEEFGFKPVWLTNQEMIEDPKYVDFISDVVERNAGELGMHLHAWTTPPFVELDRVNNEAPYLIEFPKAIMEEKISNITEFIEARTGIKPVSHRAGRWTMNQDYYDLLMQYGYLVDCSVTPHINWEFSKGSTANSSGSDYTNAQDTAHWINNSIGNKKILEVPVTVKPSIGWTKPDNIQLKSIAKAIKYAFAEKKVWLRPTLDNRNQMLKLVKEYSNNDRDYIMFMIHSSELMPGGSKVFNNDSEIDLLYKNMNLVFQEVSKNYLGITLHDYYKKLEFGV